MQDAASNTDLFKALDNFMATLAAFAPGSHREDVVLEVGDAAFRAIEQSLYDKYHCSSRPIPEKPSGSFNIEWNGEAGRVVIRKRQPSRDEREAQLEREKASAHENVPAPPGTMPKAAPCPHGNVGCGVTRVCEVCKRETKAPSQPKPDGPTISPRQALGEALACVERAVALMGYTTVHLSGGADRAQAIAAHDRLVGAKISLSQLYEAAK